MKWEKVTLTTLIEKPISGEWGIGEGNVKVIRTTNFTNDGTIDFTDIVLRDISPGKVEKKKLKKGDIIIEKSGGSPTQPVGRVVHFLEEGELFLCNNFTAVLRPKENVLSRYLFWCLYFGHTKGSTLKYQNKTTGIINLQLDRYCNEHLVPLPPLHIQEQIADALDKADALCRKNQELLQKYDELAQAIFFNTFELEIDKFKLTTLNDVCLKITDGTHQSPKFLDSGIPFLFVSNIKDDSIKYDTDRFISEEEYNELYKRTPIEMGDILLTTVGSYGNPAIIEKEDKFMFQRHIAYLKLDKNKINPYFLLRQFKSLFIKRQIEARVKGIAQKTLNLSELNKITVIVPSIHLQDKYAEYELNIKAGRNKLLKSISSCSDLFKSLSVMYFS